MINLMAIEGKNAARYFLKPEQLSDFMALIRTIVSGKVLIISTEHRTDLFYNSEASHHEAILKSWQLYTTGKSKEQPIDLFTLKSGDKESLTWYFQAICRIAQNWYLYMIYRKAFHKAFGMDQQNSLAITIAQCDQHLLKQCGVDRLPLISPEDTITMEYSDDNYALAILIKKEQERSN